MNRLALAMLLAFGLFLPQPATLAQAPVTSPELEEGIRQVREGDFDVAVVTLDDLARRLGQQRGQSKLLARTYVYLSIAYLGLSQVEQARTKFLEALEADEAIDLNPSEFPPKYMEFFEEARADAAAAQTGSAQAPESAETPSKPDGRPASVPAPAVAEDTLAEPAATAGTQKKGGSKTLLVVGGVAAAGGLVAVVAGGGGSGSAPSAPASTPAPAPTPTPAATVFDHSWSLEPPPGSTLRVPPDGWVDLRLDLDFACSQSRSGMTVRAVLFQGTNDLVGSYVFDGQTCAAGQSTRVTAGRLLVQQPSRVPGQLAGITVNAYDSAGTRLDPLTTDRTMFAQPYELVWE